MKRLKLKALEFGATEVLTREHLKRIAGGDGSFPYCSGGAPIGKCSCGGGSQFFCCQDNSLCDCLHAHGCTTNYLCSY